MNTSRIHSWVYRVVVLHESYDLPVLTDDGMRRECAIELKLTGEWLTAIYNEVTEKWNPAYGAPVEELPKDAVAQWCYLDELFAR